jgi:adenosylmethionine-8-amino-7-oxononanoate aminotransferase
LLRHGYTYSGHPTAAAAALANLDVIEKEGLLSRALGIEKRLGSGLASLVDGEHVVELRGTRGIWALGLTPGLEAPVLRDTLLEYGVIARPIGTTALAFCPPLVITEEQMDRCVDGTRQAIAAVTTRVTAS